MSNYISKQTILDLVEDYERRSKTANQMLDNPEVIGEQWHRVQGKYEAYRSFIGELLTIELCKVEPDGITELAVKALKSIAEMAKEEKYNVTKQLEEIRDIALAEIRRNTNA